jgi:hypothetical protein
MMNESGKNPSEDGEIAVLFKLTTLPYIGAKIIMS